MGGATAKGGRAATGTRLIVECGGVGGRARMLVDLGLGHLWVPTLDVVGSRASGCGIRAGHLGIGADDGFGTGFGSFFWAKVFGFICSATANLSRVGFAFALDLCGYGRFRWIGIIEDGRVRDVGIRRPLPFNLGGFMRRSRSSNGFRLRKADAGPMVLRGLGIPIAGLWRRCVVPLSKLFVAGASWDFNGGVLNH